MTDSMTAMLRERFSVIMALALLAAAWQVSGNTVNAATVSEDGGVLGAEVMPFSQFDMREDTPLGNSLKTLAVALPCRL
jgi:putative aminopeptidase FrvX